MKDYDALKPKKRSRLRVKLGTAYYMLKRYALWTKWRLTGVRLAKKDTIRYLERCASHQTPLLRQLKDVDMVLQYNKITNLKLAVGKLDGMVLSPGEILSYWMCIGRTTKRKGYMEGMVLQSGTFRSGVGGGLCQLSNLIYWMTLHTPLTVLERHRHSYDVFPDSNRTLPFGSGATCSYNYLDLVIKNNTDQPFQLCLEVTDTHLQGSWCSDRPWPLRYEVVEKDHCMTREYWGGYSRHNALYRRVYTPDDQMLSEEFLIENHALMMYQPFLPQAVRTE